MQGYADLLRDGELSALAPEQQQAMFVIVDQAYELRTLVDRIGILMALEAHKGAPVPVRWPRSWWRLCESDKALPSRPG